MKHFILSAIAAAAIVGCSVQAQSPEFPTHSAKVSLQLQVGSDLDLFVAQLARGRAQAFVNNSGVMVDTSIRWIVAMGTALGKTKDTTVTVNIGDTLALSAYTQNNTGDNFRDTVYQERRVVTGAFTWKVSL